MHRLSVTKLLLMGLIHFLLMYFLMYAMVDVFAHVVFNLNQVYMAGLMTAPMLILEVILMRSMYRSPQTLNLILGASVLILIVSFVFIRRQTFIFDRAFLRSMIPHHAGAILMCRRASLADPEIIGLCQSIIDSQQSEIDHMQQILGRLE